MPIKSMPLIFVVRSVRDENVLVIVVQTLLVFGANPNGKDKYTVRPLKYASEKGYTKITRMLLNMELIHTSNTTD